MRKEKSTFEYILRKLRDLNGRWTFQVNSFANLPIVAMLNEDNPHIEFFQLIFNTVGTDFFRSRLKQQLLGSRYTMGIICNYVAYEMKSLIEWKAVEERRKIVQTINRIIDVFGNDIRWRAVLHEWDNNKISDEVAEELSIVSVLDTEMDDKLMAARIVKKLRYQFNLRVSLSEQETVE